eukprot:CCRYP_000609-RB/>CCRYP_000609-RB protein AED:0.43 eAED:0.50 QI:0/0/0/1/0/0/3/0/172
MSKALTGFQHPHSSPRINHTKPPQSNTVTTCEGTVHLSQTLYQQNQTHRASCWPPPVLLTCYVDPTLAAALSTIMSQQSKGMQAVMDVCKELLNYAATHPNASIRYCVSDILALLSLRTGGQKSRHRNYPDFHNDAALILSTIIKHTMASSSKKSSPPCSTATRKPSLYTQL